MCNLKRKATKIVNDFSCAVDDGGAESGDYIDLYESILKLAEEHAKGIQYECEAKIDALTEGVA